jgi:hypothetical protein
MFEGFVKKPKVTDCTKLIDNLNIDCSKRPEKLFCIQCEICGCIANHNGYTNPHNFGDVCCESCEKEHPGKLCNEKHIGCDNCKQSLVDVILSKPTKGMVLIKYARKVDQHRCENYYCCGHFDKMLNCKHCAIAEKECSAKKHCKCLKKDHIFYQEHSCSKCGEKGHHSYLCHNK